MLCYDPLLFMDIHTDSSTSISESAPVGTGPRVLVVKLSSIGDLIHTLPAVHCLKSGLNATIDWVVQDSYAELVRCFTDVSQVIPFYRKSFFRRYSEFIAHLRLHRYDLVLDFQGILKSAIVTRLAHGQRTIGPSFPREGSRFLYPELAGLPNRTRHAVDEHYDFIRHLALPELDPQFPMAFPLQLLSEPQPRVAIVPVSRWPSKNWPLPFFAEVGRAIQEHANASIILIGGPGDIGPCTDLAAEFKGRAINMAGKLTLTQLGGFLKEMNLVISNDSGPAHIAAALGTPTLTIFGPSDPVRTSPYGNGNQVLKGRLRCQPCLSRVCRFKDNSCVRTVTPQIVIAAAMDMLHPTRRKLRR